MRISTILQWAVIAGIFILVVLGVPVFANIAFPHMTVPALAGQSQSGSPAGCPDADRGGFYQDALSPSPQPFIKQIDDFTFTLQPLFRYRIVGKIMGKDEYGGAATDRLAPMDLTIANGDILRPEIISHFTVQKYSRHFRYFYSLPPGTTPMSQAYATEHISNNHLIFANDAVYSTAQTAVVGDMVEISGYLVTVSGKSRDGRTFSQRTSTTRSDQGEQSCEVVYVEMFRKFTC